MTNSNRLAQSRAGSFVARDSYTRPANTTQYAAGDAVSDDATTPTLLTFTVGRINGGGALIRSATLHKSDQDTTAAAFDLLLFDTAPAVAGLKDNAALAVTDAEFLAGYLGFIRFAQASAADHVTGDSWTVSPVDLYVVPASDSKDIYGVLVAQDTYTPASAEVLAVTLTGQQD